jgi:hypothetical protein
MRRFTIPLLAFGFLVLFGVGCDALSNEERGTVTLTGIVVDQSDEGVPNAFVTVMPQDEDVETDAGGLYSIDVDIDSTMDLTVTARKNGYSTASTVVLAIAGREIDVPALRIVATDDFVQESGKASNIILQSLSTQQVGVKEAGSEEIATITFQVTDSTGRPLSLNQATNVSFAFGAQPGGGEFLFPTSIRTDNDGEARVNLAAGTQAGVVQIIASTVVDGVTIRSNPAAMSIHGGHPDQEHFSLGPQVFNFPGLLRFGETNRIAVYVGDQYSNPARPNSSVYFHSTHGIIQGSTLTSVDGSGAVTLFSGNPLPNVDGIATITATTADLNNDPVTASIPVLFTGAPVITLTQTGSSDSPFARRFAYTVTDGLGNPLGPGTAINVKAGGVKVEAVGDVAVELGDTVILGEPGSYSVVRGPGITEFEFSVVEQTIADVADPPSLDVVTVSVSGPNGKLQLTAGASGKTSASEGATIEHLDANTIRVRAN